ncbi:CG7837 [Drosophila busckii]|uniref:CG7837 n=1 Tax=Drosophila busckii TaxID=30019 RepID=A0A0M4F7X7_DROBS|nr:uncharacterized protein LOC108603921 [Drosophila busckii]ALC48045.1 CG7837 [Drosophila busckii]
MFWSLEQVEGMLGVLESSNDKAVIYKCLVKLRTDLIKDKDGIVMFRTAGGIPVVSKLITKLNEKIMEVVLSILGNCCTDEQACIEAVECKVIAPLITILKTIPNPLIQCRACRMLGNVAKSKKASSCLSVHYSAIAPAICHIIDSTSTAQTRIMAFRVCRFLLVSSQFYKHFLSSNGFLQLMRIFVAVMKNNDAPKESTQDVEVSALIGLKRNQHREKYFEEVARNLEGVRSDIFDYQMLKNSTRNCEYILPKESEAVELAYEILKCLLVLSAQQIGFKAWEHLSRNTFLAPVVYFVKEDSDQRAAALKILSNFCKDPCAFYMLSTADAIVAACELLMAVNMAKPLTESECRHCVNIISTLSADACSRSKIRRCGALRKLVAMIRESHSQSERSSLFHILNNFQYDNLSMELLLYEGLVPMLVRELNDYLTSDEEHHKKRREERIQGGKKRKAEPITTETLSKFSKTQDALGSDFESPSSSPRSYRTTSPCSSRSMSPICSNLIAHDDDENYSPACSDDDDDSNCSTGANNETRDCRMGSTRTHSNNVLDLLNQIDEASEHIDDALSDKEDMDELSSDVPPKMAQLRYQAGDTIDVIENLIYRITLMINKRPELGKPETLDALIRAINLFGANNNFANALTNILLESQFFAQIIKHGVVHQLYQLTKVEEMRKDGFAFLETLTNVGESNYGKEELVRLLRCDTDINAQQRAAISVAYIIKSHRLLYQFLYDGNALTLLFDLLLRKRTDNLYADEAADAVTAMSRFTLGITLPEAEPPTADAVVCSTQLNVAAMPLHEHCDMHFLVHSDANSEDTLSIGFNKQLLCDTSEVFNKMLNSDFRERKGEIQLSAFTASGLRYFLHLISCNERHLSMPDYCALLQAFEMSRVYIIPELEALLHERLIHLLDAHNCLRLLEWALKNYHAELTEMAISYYLCAALPAQDKLLLFRTAEDSTYATEWFQLLNDAVYERCRSTGY